MAGRRRRSAADQMDVSKSPETTKSGKRSPSSGFDWLPESGDEDEFHLSPPVVRQLSHSPARLGWRRRRTGNAGERSSEMRRRVSDAAAAVDSPDRKKRISEGNNRRKRISSRHLSQDAQVVASRPGRSKLCARPELPDYIYTPAYIKDVSTIVYQVNIAMHFKSLDLRETPTFAGSGSYGEVTLYNQSQLAVKTAIDGFRSELLMTILAGECAIRAKSVLLEERIAQLLAFSLPAKQMVFKAYHMDMSSYCRKLVRMNRGDKHWRAIERTFIGLGRAVAFLNIGCGLTHLDIKCGNIFVNVSSECDPIIEEAVLGDFSLMILNENSTVMRAIFNVEVGRQNPYELKVCRGNVQPVFELILGHGQTQPCEIMLDAMNGEGLLNSKTPLSGETGLAIDMYALGQSLLELILSAGLGASHGLVLPRNPVYFYYHKLIRRDYLLDTMAYRCAFYRFIFPATPLTSRYDVPWERAERIRPRLNDLRHRAAFDLHLSRYKMTHTHLFNCIKVPSNLKQVLELAALYCHANPEARSAIPLLWK
ncbi:tegument serine/threonine protein kinase [Falconid herpesvirus 1]|uniref:Tegument serine/threonine protein kinase n=1 Tax=Falconid herpesvirus 1 TaxID=1510155 RepID=A0A068EPH7_9ALPH|nr:tegument serine/threonine protein kinase [Falconid herpesvirus 1]AID52713.1 tegument serine/threonine protein kinase [Falconid herpesvirus 1]